MHAATLPQLFHAQAERFGRRVAVRYRQHGLFHDLRWDDYHEQVNSCAAALILHGIQKGDRVAILSENRLEWLITDMAIQSAGAVNVPLHATFEPPAKSNFSSPMPACGSCSCPMPCKKRKSRKFARRCPNCSASGSIRFAGRALLKPRTKWSSRGESAVRGIDGAASNNQRPTIWRRLSTPSGTTANPKGVMLTQNNLVSNALAFTQVSSFGPDCVFLNWLPFSHIYARTVDIYVKLAVGATLCLEESAESVIADLAAIQPTNMSGVPRFYGKRCLPRCSTTIPRCSGRVAAAGIFGRRIDFLGSGGAPLPGAVAQAFYRAGLLLLQGYGLTESSPVISFNRKDRHKIETVGQPIPGIEVRIGPDGEVLTRGPHVMKGYWNNPRETALALEDGWLHTGDLGELDADGFLSITGRKKDLLVLSNGKKVIPSHLEGILLGDPCIDQAMICGEGRSFLSALIVPHWGNVSHALSLTGTPTENARLPAVRAFLEARIQAALQHEAAWEQIQKLSVILAEPFSVANDEMTVSLKLRRNVIAANHRQELDVLYE